MNETLGYAYADTAIGTVIVVSDATGICMVDWGDDETALLERARRSFPRADLVEADHDASSLARGVAAMIEDARTARADLPLSLRGTPFQVEVWEALRTIPAGQTRSYAEVAAQVGRPTAYRAVAQACARNPVPIVVPCHRVVSSDGSLGGFSGGVWRKEELLKREGARG